MSERMIAPVTQVIYANTFFSRLKGLLGTRQLPADTGLLLEPCNSIHTWGMGYAIDVLFLDDHNRVLQVAATLSPNTWGQKVPGACRVLEMAAGQACRLGIQPGDVIDLNQRKEGI
ncbi:DUF192 domain-containing protein [Anoxynatronum buryatiense]|uniref:DUF192 domain-containing protein n=1 Tax=Anoxynatronum buryatiense TaxID=489973 RepID=A0AA46AJZ7_9CLOT|nr:DUF192 domain-containing protein [Anoxynatronum buryatiense]SMP65119.1 hypothetical protein SAMN06296020_11260 [Anoxynatronum buryatiense]